MEHTHVINKVFLEINVDNKEKANEIKENISNFLSIEVLPELEKCIDSLQEGITTDILQIDTLNLDVTTALSNLKTSLKTDVITKLKQELTELINPLEQNPRQKEIVSHLSETEQLVKTFIHFLEKGTAPWWYNQSISNLLSPITFKKLLSSPDLKKALIQILEKQYVKRRIINQLSNEEIGQLALTVFKGNCLDVQLDNTTIHKISKLPEVKRKLVWSMILNYLDKANKPSPEEAEEAQELVENTIKTLNLADKAEEVFIDNIETESQNQDNIEEPQHIDEGLYVNNVGLILIHPFLKTLFKHCNLLSEQDELIKPELSAHLLHYIATGETNQVESDMVFEKYICNIPLSQSIKRHVNLSEEYKNEAVKVIEAVKANWNPMKNSSTELLRNEFFQRPGKLTFEGTVNLTIEKKTQDILLERLGWGIGIVKLPWHDDLIYTNWV